VVVGPSKQEREVRRALEAASIEGATADMRAVAAIERLNQTAATRYALARLTEGERRLRTIHAEMSSSSEGSIMDEVFNVAEASGGCRKVRSAIGG
jgi:hypothetical protein